MAQHIHTVDAGHAQIGEYQVELHPVDRLECLFATLDATTRRYRLSNGKVTLLTDTVGFIRKLPHLLIDAFRATLEETQIADFLASAKFI